MQNSTTLRGAAAGSFSAVASIVALVGLADFLFYGHDAGWTVGLFTFAILMVLLLRPSGSGSRNATVALSVATGALALTMFEEPTPLSLTVTCVTLILLAITRRQGWTSSGPLWLARLALFWGLGWTKVFPDAVLTAEWKRRHPSPAEHPTFAPVRAAGKWVVPLVLGGVFLLLFAAANPVVERWCSQALKSVQDQISRMPDLLDPARFAFWVMDFVCLWGLLRVRTRHPFIPRRRRRYHRPFRWKPLNLDRLAEIDPGIDPPEPAPFFSTPAVETHVILPPSRRGLVERCLIVFNLIFAMETFLDILYLWGGRHLPAGMSYKEYAHRGSYPLIATALLSGAFVLLMFGRECDGATWRTARILVYAWLIQNVLLTFSAGWRLALLINASNLTRLRLATILWLLLIVGGLVSILWRIVKSRDNHWFVGINMSMAAALLYVCCFLNLDGFIADYNASHCMDVARGGDVLGLTYLRDLGIESIPALDRLSHTLDTPERRDFADQLANALRTRNQKVLTEWRGWTWRRARLAK